MKSNSRNVRYSFVRFYDTDFCFSVSRSYNVASYFTYELKKDVCDC